MKFFPRDAGRPPNWRYHNAGEIAKRIVEDFRVRPSFPSDDKWASIAALFFYRMECARTARQQEVQAARRPDLFHAYSLYMSLARAAKALVFEVECRLLAGQTDDEIAEHTGLPPAAIGWYEALFFCVRDCRQATGWIYRMLRKKHRLLGRWEEFAIQFLCYLHGPRAIPFLLHGVDVADRPAGPNEAGGFFDRQTRRNIHRKALLADVGGLLDSVGSFDAAKQWLTKIGPKKSAKSRREEKGLSKVEAVADGLLAEFASLITEPPGQQGSSTESQGETGVACSPASPDLPVGSGAGIDAQHRNLMSA